MLQSFLQVHDYWHALFNLFLDMPKTFGLLSMCMQARVIVCVHACNKSAAVMAELKSGVPVCVPEHIY